MYKKGKISIITPTYNRAKTLHRVFESLEKQTYKNFEWIIIDDGSTDETKVLVDTWSQEVDYIRYVYQPNAGKHIAVNRALAMATGEYTTTVDSDDEIREDAFQILIDAWNEIPEKDRKKYKNVTAKCYDPQTGKPIGASLPGGQLDCSSLDARYIYKMNYERWGMTRTEVAIQYKSKEIGGKFYPETIMQDLCARKYIERYIDVPLRGYYRDAGNALTKNKINKENFYLWTHNINDNMDYFKYDPKSFIKSYIGITMTGFANGYKLSYMIKNVNRPLDKMITIFFAPAGFVALWIKK